MRIGIFDSGVGGLTILKKIIELLPEYEYVYLADTARAPYGDRSERLIFEFTQQGVAYLMREHNCALVILACNTASALALRRLQQEWLQRTYPDRKILGIIIPTVEYITEKRLSNPIAVIGTRGTISSRVYEKEIKKRSPVLFSLIQHACPLLVPLIEEGWDTTSPARMILKNYLRPLKNKQIRTLVLGCTHYSVLAKTIRQIMGRNVSVVEQGEIIARSLRSYLVRHSELEKKCSRKKSVLLLSTDVSERSRALFQRHWEPGASVERVALE